MDKLAAGDSRMMAIAMLFVWTTTTCINLIKLQIQEVSQAGWREFFDTFNVLELLYIAFQVTARLTHMVVCARLD
jgi:hypothetical protein